MTSYKKTKYKYLVGDFETTVYKGQTHTEVWASAVVEMHSEDVLIHHSIGETWDYLLSLNENVMIYYHNLKFDGEFWLYYFLNSTDIKQSVKEVSGDTIREFYSQKEMPENTFRYTISDMGQWYEICVKKNGKYIIFRDSLKLLPFSVKVIGESFDTKHRKLEMEYEGYRYAGCEITEEEKQYIANDVLVVKEALEFMFSQGFNKMTIGACCLAEFKKQFEFGHMYDNMFPDLSKIKIDKNSYGSENADEYIRKSYQGGWCYVVKGKEEKLYDKGGLTADVNSLYPSMMHSKSGNYFPTGLPKFWKGKIPYAEMNKKVVPIYFFVRFRCRFYLRKDKLPFVHIRGCSRYRATENLITSDVRDKKTGLYSRYYKDLDGKIKDSVVELTMTCTDWKLFNEHYIIEDLEILDGCYFGTVNGFFDPYIDEFMKIKKESKGGKRTWAKLCLNNLYGKFASSNVSNFRVAEKDENGEIHYYTVQANDKKIGYIPIGSAITSYARNFTIRAAQSNYYGKDNRGFIYADTDSIHCDLAPEELINIPVDSKELCNWKLESYWDKAIFVRQKTYIEHVTHEDGEKIKEPYYNVKCAGMPDRCKNLLIKSFDGISENEKKDYSDEELEFLETKRTMKDFKQGLIVPSKLMPKRIEGGIILVETTYELR